MNPLVSVVTICWNRKADILESLEGIFNTTYDNLEVIVVDNNSTDGTAQEISERFPAVRLIRLFKNIGIEAYNIGFINARGEYVVILDDDSHPERHAIERMVRKFQKDPKLGIVAFDVRNFFKYDEVATLTVDEEADNEAVSQKYLMGFNGAGAGIRRDLLEECGFYPEEFFLYWNEADLAFRVLNRDMKVIFFSDVVSYHKYSPKNRSSERAPFFYCRNMFWLLWKNYPLGYALKKTAHLIYLCYYYSIEQGTLVYLKAMLNAFANIKIPMAKRNPVKDEIWKNLRIPFETSFTFFR